MTQIIDSNLKIVPHSPEWFRIHCENFTGSEAWKLLTNPRGKSPLQRFEDHAVKLAQMEAKFSKVLPEKMGLKSNISLKARIDKNLETYKILNEKKNDFHFSDTAETYILEKVHGKLTGISASGIDNAATQWGIEHEPVAKVWYTRITGRELLESYMEFHPTIEGFSCTTDAPIVPEGILEIKCPYNGSNHLKHWLISSDDYMKEKHENHYWQMTSQMNILGQPWGDFVSFDPRINNDRGMFIYRLEYNEDDGKLLEERIIRARELFNDYFSLFSQGAAA